MTPRRDLLILGAICGSLCLLLLLWRGVLLGGDSGAYIDAAEQLRGGEAITGKGTSYPLYVAILAAAQVSGVGLTGVVLLQALILAVTVWPIFALGTRLRSTRAGLIAAALFAINLDLIRFGTYILTDALYVCAVVWATWSIAVAAEKRRWWYLLSLAMCLVAATLRPNGLLMFLIAGLWWAYRSDIRTVARAAFAGGVICAFLGAALLLPTPAGGAVRREDPAALIPMGEVMWRHPAVRLDMPEMVEGEGVTSYVARHPLPVIRLVSTRIGLELVHTRYYFSVAHNIAIALTLFPVYAFALIGAFLERRRRLLRLLLGVAGAHLAIVGITFADYDGRWLFYFLPLIYVMAGAGADGVLGSLTRRNARTG